MHVYLLMYNPKLASLRVSTMEDDDEGGDCLHCSECGRAVRGSFVLKGEVTLAIRCKGCVRVQALWNKACDPSPEEVPVVVDEKPKPKGADPNKPATCSECNGGLKGRGYKHTDECSLNTKNKTPNNRTCDKCGGKARGRGFSHVGDCKNKSSL